MKTVLLPLVLTFLIAEACRPIRGRGVHYQPTRMPVVRAMLNMANAAADVVYDLGSRHDRIPIAAAKECGASRAG